MTGPIQVVKEGHQQDIRRMILLYAVVLVFRRNTTNLARARVVSLYFVKGEER
jgi:hypothetical protein